ncbi:serpentine type 7TM GPCR chemoreceptor srv domain-containing protein [Ditylenchus destructor]|nr:serpentine type 7TM GPCR chemoreceptor srv domain-containing protein [Ditylenchus destructor]
MLIYSIKLLNYIFQMCSPAAFKGQMKAIFPHNIGHKTPIFLVLVRKNNVTAKFNDYGWFPDFYTHNHVVARIAILGGTFIAYYQTWANFFLAANRFIVIVLPKRDMKWYSRIAIFTNHILALLGTGIRTPVDAEYVPDLLNSTFTLTLGTDEISQRFTSLLVTIQTPVGIVQLIITLILEIATLICVKRYLRRAAIVSKAQISEIQLVFFSLYTFFVFLLLVLSNFLALFAGRAGNKALINSILGFNYWMYEAKVLVPPVAMFIISSFVRNEYLRFYGLRKNNTTTPVESVNTTGSTNQPRT